jgi:hypothetical protein
MDLDPQDPPSNAPTTNAPVQPVVNRRDTMHLYTISLQNTLAAMIEATHNPSPIPGATPEARFGHVLDAGYEVRTKFGAKNPGLLKFCDRSASPLVNLHFMPTVHAMWQTNAYNRKEKQQQEVNNNKLQAEQQARQQRERDLAKQRYLRALERLDKKHERDTNSTNTEQVVKKPKATAPTKKATEKAMNEAGDILQSLRAPPTDDVNLLVSLKLLPGQPDLVAQDPESPDSVRAAFESPKSNSADALNDPMWT